jgi:hypothetical protein
MQRRDLPRRPVQLTMITAWPGLQRGGQRHEPLLGSDCSAPDPSARGPESGATAAAGETASGFLRGPSSTPTDGPDGDRGVSLSAAGDLRLWWW